jgi:hypothetical protein
MGEVLRLLLADQVMLDGVERRLPEVPQVELAADMVDMVADRL